MGDTGLEQSAMAGPKTQISENDGAESGAPKDENDSNLAWLTEHWSSLPEPVRKQIVSTARAALKTGGSAK